MQDHYKMKLDAIDKPEDKKIKAIFEQSEKQNKMVPNLYRVMANAPELLEAYTSCYQLLGNSGFNDCEREVIFLTISYENSCDYCMAAHSTLADFSSNVPVDVTNAIRDDKPIPDEKLQALASMTREMLTSRGRPDPKEVENFINAGYEEKQLLDIVLSIATKTMSNYTNHLFETPIDKTFKARNFKITQFAARVFQKFTRK